VRGRRVEWQRNCWEAGGQGGDGGVGRKRGGGREGELGREKGGSRDVMGGEKMAGGEWEVRFQEID